MSGGAVLLFQVLTFIVTPWVAETEFPVSPAPTAVTDESAPPLTTALASRPVVTLWTVDDDLPVRPQDDYWWSPSPSPSLTATTAQPVTADEELPGAHVVFEEDGWQGFVLAPPSAQQPWATTDEPPPPVLADDYWWQGASPSTGFVAAVLFDDEILPGAHGVSEDDTWPPPSSVTAWPVAVATVWATDGLPQPAAAPVDEPYWWQAPSGSPPSIPSALTDDEILPGALAFTGDDYWWRAQWITPPLAEPARTDDEILPGARALTEDEYWWRPARVHPDFTVTAGADDDVLPAAPAATPIEDEGSWCVPVVVQESGIRLAWVSSEVAPAAAASTPPFTGTPAPLVFGDVRLVIAPWTVDDEVVPTTAAPLDEVYVWQAPPVAPQPLTPVWAANDETVPVAPAEEAYFWQGPPPAPLPVVTIWTIADQEIGPAASTIIGEEYWWAASPWPERTSRPFTDDEILPGASATPPITHVSGADVYPRRPRGSNYQSGSRDSEYRSDRDSGRSGNRDSRYPERDRGSDWDRGRTP